MDNMTAMSVIKLMPATNSQQKEFVRQILSKALSGDINPLELETYLKSIEDVIKAVRGNIEFKGAIQEEVDKYPEKEFKHGNAVIVKASRATADYSGDEEWVRINNSKKDREKFLKGLSKPMADPDTGELVHPPTYKTAEFLKIRFEDE